MVREVLLPGVGWRYDITEGSGSRLSVVCRSNGQCNLIVYDDPADPDAGRHLVTLTRDEALALAGFLAARTCIGGLPTAAHTG